MVQCIFHDFKGHSFHFSNTPKATISKRNMGLPFQILSSNSPMGPKMGCPQPRELKTYPMYNLGDTLVHAKILATPTWSNFPRSRETCFYHCQPCVQTVEWCQWLKANGQNEELCAPSQFLFVYDKIRIHSEDILMIHHVKTTCPSDFPTPTWIES